MQSTQLTVYIVQAELLEHCKETVHSQCLHQQTKRLWMQESTLQPWTIQRQADSNRYSSLPRSCRCSASSKRDRLYVCIYSKWQSSILHSWRNSNGQRGYSYQPFGGNGIIHVIDKVLMPTPTPNDIPRTAVPGIHDSLVAAVIQAELLETSGEGPFIRTN